jgi:hypothetical protein
MIRHVSNKEIDRQKWDDFLKRSFNSNIYALSGYLDIAIPTWEALIKNDYEAIMPLPSAKKWGISYLGTPFLTQQLGIFYLEGVADPTDEFLAHIPDKFRWLDMKLNRFNHSEKFKQHIQNSSNFEIDLQFEYKTLQGSYSENTRRNIKKAQRHDFKIVYADKPDMLIDLFKTDKGKTLSSVTQKNYETLKAACSFLIKDSSVIMPCALLNGEVVAGVVFIRFKNKWVFIFSGNSQKGKETGAMFYLIDDFIRKQSGANQILDFEGSNNPSLARFYKGFGALDLPYPVLKFNKLPPLLNLIK